MGIPSILYDNKKHVGKRLGAFQKAKRRAYQRMLGEKVLKVKAPKGGGHQEVIAGAITPIPPVTNPNMREVELQPVAPTNFCLWLNFAVSAMPETGPLNLQLRTLWPRCPDSA